MKPQIRHPWKVSPAKARDIQRRLRGRVSLQRFKGPVHHIAGVDISVKQDLARAAIVVLLFPELEIVEIALAEEPVPFPYVPGLLSFREIPSILRAANQLKTTPDLLLVDGQGIAHPRRFGLASHLGVLLDLPTIGCAKSRYIGAYDEPHHEAGCYTDLLDSRELIGAVLRTRDNVKPLFISVGHKIDLPTAIDLVLESCAGYRLPEPTRLAHQAAGRGQV